MSIASALQGYVDDDLWRSAGLVDQTLDAVCAALRDQGAGDQTQSEAKRRLEPVEVLQRHRELLRTRFIDSLREDVQRVLQLHEQPEGTPSAGFFPGTEPVDESHGEVDIEISRAVQVIDSTAQWELRKLQTFTSTLCGSMYRNAQSNPQLPMHPVCRGAVECGLHRSGLARARFAPCSPDCRSPR